MLAKLFISLVRISPSFQKAVWKWWYQRLGKRGHDWMDIHELWFQTR